MKLLKQLVKLCWARFVVGSDLLLHIVVHARRNPQTRRGEEKVMERCIDSSNTFDQCDVEMVTLSDTDGGCRWGTFDAYWSLLVVVCLCSLTFSLMFKLFWLAGHAELDACGELKLRTAPVRCSALFAVLRFAGAAVWLVGLSLHRHRRGSFRGIQLVLRGAHMGRSEASPHW